MAPRKPSPADKPTPPEESPSTDTAPPAGDIPVFDPTEGATPDAPPEQLDSGTDDASHTAPAADDVPVFAPAEPAAPEEKPFVSGIPDWLEDNYRQLVDDPNRNDSFTALAERSTGALAAWARHEAAVRGEDITPAAAAPAGADTTRSADAQ